MYYIFNSEGKNIGQCDFEPSQEDLASRNEAAVYSDATFGNAIELIDGEIVEIIPPKPDSQALRVQAQAQVWEAIKQKRHAVTRSGVFIQSVGKWFHNDDPSRTQYLALQVLPSLPPDLMWKTMDNSFVPMTKDLLNEIAMTMLTEEQANFANAERHRLAMLQADNPLEYDYSTGWSETYE